MTTTSLDLLFWVDAPWICAGLGEPERGRWMASSFYSRPGLEVCVRVLRGWKLRTHDGLMSEFGAAFQFSDGYSAYGEDYYALLDCFRDMHDWLRAPVYVLVVLQAEKLLRDEVLSELGSLLVTVNDAGDYYAKETASGEWFDRPPVPFHLLLDYSDGAWNEEEERRVKEAAARFNVPLRLPSGIWTPPS